MPKLGNPDEEQTIVILDSNNNPKKTFEHISAGEAFEVYEDYINNWGYHKSKVVWHRAEWWDKIKLKTTTTKPRKISRMSMS